MPAKRGYQHRTTQRGARKGPGRFSATKAMRSIMDTASPRARVRLVKRNLT